MVAVRIGHQLERHNAGDHDKDKPWDHRHLLVLVNAVHRHQELQAKGDEVQDSDEQLMPADQAFCIPACLGWANDFSGAGPGCLHTIHLSRKEIIMQGDYA